MQSFSFNGICSDAMSLVMTDEFVPAVAARSYDTITIEGRDGEDYVPLGYKNVSQRIKCTLLNKDRLDDVLCWLRGSGIFAINGRCRKAYIYDQIEVTDHGPFKYVLEIPFIFGPFWYRDDDPFIPLDSGVIINEGNYDAAPEFRVKTFDGTVEISVHNSYGFTDIWVTTYNNFYMDVFCEDCRVSSFAYGNVTMGGFEYPVLTPGENTIYVLRRNNLDNKIYPAPELWIRRKDRWV